ncbi:VWA domain-containing protein [bacterium]|nr:VWA domain-containing protein [bacterium]
MSGFAFQWPVALALLLLAIPLALLLSHARSQRLKLIQAMGGGHSTHRRLRDVLRVLAFVLLVLALARPGHSPRMESSSRTGRDVVFALDVSQSMLAEDATPSRLEVAKQGIRDALDSFGSERVGLVVYAGSASILCPLTYDYDFIRYMLDQAHPRSVDFGGTALQSAVEKAVDQVFMDGRGGVQDLVVLTDGGDHGSKMVKVIELLEEKQVDVLAVGIGDPNRGSPIRIEDEEGNSQWLEDDGQTVYTKLDDASLRAFAAKASNAEYMAAGVRPFNLGQVYREYAEEKQVGSAESESGVKVYQEAAFFFLLPAVILLLLSECWGARGLQLGSTALWLILLGHAPEDLMAADTQFRSGYDAAVNLLESGSYEDAELAFSALYENTPTDSSSSGDLAALQINRGLCLLRLSESQTEQSPVVALNYAESAQLAFLSAKRYSPTLQRAGVRLESTAQYMAVLEAVIEAQREADAELNAEMEALVKRLQALLEAQQKLRQTSNAKDVNRNPRRANRNAPPPPPVLPPEDARESSNLFVRTQGELHAEGKALKIQMQAIDIQVAMPNTESIMAEPLSLMDSALAGQLKAKELLADWGGWSASRGEQQLVERAIEKILELLAGNSEQEYDESEDYEEYEEDYDYEYMEDSEESMNSSEAMQGDFAATSDMQALPTPNYSVDDILMEEEGSLQFRQQKRASANAAKVEKDY